MKKVVEGEKSLLIVGGVLDVEGMKIFSVEFQESPQEIIWAVRDIAEIGM